MLLLLTTLVSCSQNKLSTSGKPDSSSLVPWLEFSVNQGYQARQYGFWDTVNHKFTISPQYADAQPFQNGYAVVAKYTGKRGNRYYGVIDLDNQIVIPFKYNYIELVKQGKATLVFTKKSYNAWWRFWEWNKPSLFSHTPITRVPRDHWKVVTLPDRKTLINDRKSYLMAQGLGYHHQNIGGQALAYDILPFDLDVTSSPNLIKIDRNVYRQTGGQLKHLTSNFEVFTREGNILVKKGKQYRLLNKNGEKVNPKIFTKVKAISVETADKQNSLWRPSFTTATPYYTYQKGMQTSHHFTEESLLTKDFKRRHQTIAFQGFFEDEQGNYYLAPNFKAPFPKNIEDYKHDDQQYSGQSILENCGIITALPDGSYLIGTNPNFKNPNKAFMLKTDGSWDTHLQGVKAPVNVFSQNRISFIGEDSPGVWDKQRGYHPIPSKYIYPCTQNPMWYFSQDSTSHKYGVYNAQQQSWQVPPIYDYMTEELVSNVAVYRTDTVITKNGIDFSKHLYGLVDIKKNKKITAPIFQFIDTDGRVGLIKEVTNDYGVTVEEGLSFYLNPYTGEQYRNLLNAEK